MNLKAQIEAILFLTDKPIKALAIARLLNLDVQIVRQALLELIRDYEERNGALEIADDNGYVLQVKDDFSAIVEQFLPVEMSVALIRTLSAIAIKQPVMQSEIIKIRGAGAYEHIKELLEKELVSKEETGRSPVLTTTKRFQEYFRLTKDATTLRQSVKKMEKAAKAAEEGGQTGIDIGDTIGIVPVGSSDEQLSLPVIGESVFADESFADESPTEPTQVAESYEEQTFAPPAEPAVDETVDVGTNESVSEPSFEPGQAFDAASNAEVFTD